MSDQNPAPGWYPAPHANNEQRYWDGAQWSGAPSPGIDYPVSTGIAEKRARGLALSALIVGIVAFLTGLLPVVGIIFGLTAVALGVVALVKRQPKGLSIAGIALGGIALITSVVMTAGLGAAISAGPRPLPAVNAQPSEVSEGTTEATQEPTLVTVPDVAGMTAADAYNAVSAAGLTPPGITSFADPLAKVTGTSPAAGSQAEQGTDVTFTLEEKPKFTLGQENAIAKAKSYLSLAGFSRTGLIDQLVFEGFSTEEATFGVDNAGADWNAECAEKAQSYIALTSFSRQGLYDQLAFEGFQPSEIEFGLAAIGY